ncbi:PEP-CTERM sorting domain-containing protein [Noviherbaspirillum sp. 17J57-3]|uniref:PEP-CTERM sorting domain-containing protein n=2 Tax=Noviherbaspirillum galbum TaxID=2709383 RepID=A0A6B3SMD3_9BURK|nr:PEP-CTERM sorting domain-containing protein [Noviherbaspirillum galbum]
MSVMNNILSGAYVNDWYFNVAGVNFNQLTETFVSGVQALTATDSSNAYKADGTGGMFDVYFGFATSNPGQLAAGATSVYKFTGNGLTANSFNSLSVPDNGGGGNYVGAVHVQGYSSSVWLYGNPPPVRVPEPVPLGLLGLGMLGIAISRRQKKRS